MNNQSNRKSPSYSSFMWIAVGIFAIGLLISRVVFPELLWLTILVAALLLGALGLMIRDNQKALKSRSVAFGANSLMTVLLVLGILGVLNFIVSRHPMKADLTHNKIHTLSDQTMKLVKGLEKPVKAIFYGKIGDREKFGALLENYKNLNSKFELEYVDPDREPTRAKTAGIKKYGTLQLSVQLSGGSRDSSIEEPNEEKTTNALIKLLKDKSPTLCSITGHGEKSFTSQSADGYTTAKKALNDQAYEVRDLNILEEKKVPDSCDAIAIIGPTKAFFEPEMKEIKAYLENGGRAVIALDLDIKGGEYSPELLQLLEEWHIKAERNLIVDPLSRMLGVDSSVAILANFNRSNAITKDFQANCAFPLSRPLDIIPGAPAGLHADWIAQTTPKSWGVSDLKQLSKGQVAFEKGKDKIGPLNVAAIVEGKQKDSKATKNTRLAVFGSSHFATNNFSRYMGNLDFFLNSVSWAMEDESLISIRAKEDAPGKVEISQKTGSFIFLLSVIIVPLMISAGGIGLWVARRRL